MLKKVKKFELCRCICAVVTTERFERMDIFSGQNTESVNIYQTLQFFLKIVIYYIAF